MAAVVAVAGCRDASPPKAVLNLLAGPGFEIERDTQLIDLGSDDPETQRALVSGWSRRETGWDTSFAWVDGPRAALHFFASFPRDTAIRFRALAAPGEAGQEVGVSVNHHPLTRLHMSPDWSDYEVVAPADAVQQGENLLEFDFTTTVSGPAGDDRRLAAAFDVVRVRPVGVGGDPVATSAIVDDAGVHLHPGTALRMLVGAAAGATLALDATCAGLASNARLLVWTAATDATGGSTMLWDGSVCTGTGAGLPPPPVAPRIALPADSAARNLYIAYRANPGAPAIHVNRLALERPLAR